MKDRTVVAAFSKDLQWRFWLHQFGEQGQVDKFLQFLFWLDMIMFKTSFIDSGAEGKWTGW